MGDGRNGETLTFPDNALAAALFGEHNGHLKMIEERLGVVIHTQGNAVAISGQEGIGRARRVLVDLYALLEEGRSVTPERVADALRVVGEAPPKEVFAEENRLETPRRSILPRGLKQAEYVTAIRERDLIFAIGPAGTGKTYLAVAAAVAALVQGRYARIILTRPAVEAGERLGFLPGDLQAKVDPYLRPLYDALYDMLGAERVEKMLAQNILEIAPLAYMRGRTLEEAFVILDEAQNTSPNQMKMFLTRLGQGSKAVAAGDITQIDLPPGQESGLVDALEVLEGVEGVAVTAFTEKDVVRHPLVQRIVKAYDRRAGKRS